MKKYFLLLFVIPFFSSCAFHSGVFLSSASITNGNFQVVKTVQGTAKTTHVLGIGGLKKDAIVFEAKKDLLRKYPLEKGQVLANVSVDFKRTYVFIVATTRATLTADVVEFVFPDPDKKFDEIHYQNLFEANEELANFHVTDSVFVFAHPKDVKYNGKPKRARILGFNKDKVRVIYREYVTKDGQQKLEDFIVETELKFVFSFKKSPENFELYGFDVDEVVQATLWKDKIVTGTIFGINSYLVGVAYNFSENGFFEWKVIPLSHIRKL
jgi:hypothetical protein